MPRVDPWLLVQDPDAHDPQVPEGDDQPMTPHAAPVLDADGNLTYIGDDGRRYVVAPPPQQGDPEQRD